MFKDCFNKYGYNFDDVSKMATLDLIEIMVFWNKSYGVIISVHDATNKILSRDSNYIVDVAKFGNSSIARKEVILTTNL